MATPVAASNIGPLLTALLRRYGLQGLESWASNMLITGASEAEIELSLYDQPAFKARFPAIFELERQGYPPISTSEYLDYEATASNLSAMWGVNLTKAEVDGLISNRVSNVELEKRFEITATAIYQSDIETRENLERFGVPMGDQMRYWMDPKKELGDLQTRYRMGELGGAAERTGFGRISFAQAQRLAETGITRESAISGFGELTRMKEIFSPINRMEDVITTDEQIEFLAGDAEASRRIEERVRQRQAEFEGGGTFAAGQEGFGGLATAQ